MNARALAPSRVPEDGGAMAAAAPRILVADDHALIRLSLRVELERAGFTICAEAATGAEALEAALRERPDLCLLDVTMPEGGGIGAAAVIKREFPEMKILLITAEPTLEGALAATRVGADGYLDKQIEPERLPEAIHAVLAGDTAFSEHVERENRSLREAS